MINVTATLLNSRGKMDLNEKIKNLKAEKVKKAQKRKLRYWNEQTYTCKKCHGIRFRQKSLANAHVIKNHFNEIFDFNVITHSEVKQK